MRRASRISAHGCRWRGRASPSLPRRHVCGRACECAWRLTWRRLGCAWDCMRSARPERVDATTSSPHAATAGTGPSGPLCGAASRERDPRAMYSHHYSVQLVGMRRPAATPPPDRGGGGACAPAPAPASISPCSSRRGAWPFGPCGRGSVTVYTQSTDYSSQYPTTVYQFTVEEPGEELYVTVPSTVLYVQ